MGTEYFAVGFTILFTIATSALLGSYMAKVFTGRRTFWIRSLSRSSDSCCA